MLGLMAYPGRCDDPISRGSALEREELEKAETPTMRMDKEKPQSASSITADDPCGSKSHRRKQEEHSTKQERRQRGNNVYSYFHQIEEIQKEYIEKLYENTVDAPCQPGTFCELHQLDLIDTCRHPMSLLPFFHNSKDGRPTPSEPIFPGVYTVPKSCEYCGAESTENCNHAVCRRPQLYLQKRRPPFVRPDPNLWDPETDYSLDTAMHADEEEKKENEEKPQNSSWIEDMLFGEGNS